MHDDAALVYTDLVDSTQLGAQLGEAAMLQLWARHDQQARALVRDSEGIEVGRSDGFLLLFPTAAQALAFADAYHALLRALHPALKSRIGLHVGPVRLRTNTPEDTALGATRYDLDGSALPVVARVMSAALPGQTLVTASAWQALGPRAAGFASHGHWRFKGVQEPLALFEAPHPDAPLLPPPDAPKAYQVVLQQGQWLPRRAIAHNLPAERDAFVGRRDDLRLLAQQLASGARLVTLLGAGGTGKTRTALQFARTWLGEFPGGVNVCDLSQARRHDELVRAVAQGLDLTLGAQDPVEQIGHALAGRREALVILDNFEQVVALAPATLGRWLDLAPQVQFLVTTRALLGLPGETLVHLDPLPAADGAALFALRATAIAPGWCAGGDDAAAIDRLVHLLDGLPLAIELAAARVRLLPPRALLQRMHDRFRLLAVGAGRSDRQATLRGALDWSWELLNAAEKSVLAQLSVFEGGCTLAAAEAVLQLPDAAADGSTWSLDVVQSLLDKSLLRPGRSGRVELLQSVQQYAAGHLATPGRFDGSGPEALRAAQQRHGLHFAAFDEAAATAGGGAELDNLVAACRRAVERDDPEVATGALVAGWHALRLTGPATLALELARQVGTLQGLSGLQRALVDGIAGSALCVLGQTDAAARCLQQALDATQGSPLLQDWQLRWWCTLAEVDMGCNRLDAAQAALDRAWSLSLDGDAPAQALQVLVLIGRGSLALERGQTAQARAHHEAALALARAQGDTRRLGGLLSNLGVIALGEGRLDDAQALFSEALQQTASTGHKRWQGYARCNLAWLLLQRGALDQAQQEFESTLALARSLGSAQLEATVLCNLGLVAEAQGRARAAAVHLRAAVAATRQLDDQRSEGLFSAYLGRVLAALGQHAEAGACLAAGEALLRPGGDSTSLALLLCCRTQAACSAGDAAAAAAALAEAERLCEAAAQAPDAELAGELARARSAAAALTRRG